MIIVMDGPAGAGKSTVAREVARRLALPYLDTGAIYRAITWGLLQKGIPAQDSPLLHEALAAFKLRFEGTRVFLDETEVTEQIRTPEIDREVSPYSALPQVRSALLRLQRDAAGDGVVAEGRDMGTVVFPDADLKIFLTASEEVRADRRHRERVERGEEISYGEVREQVSRRDAIDSSRAAAPLCQADDALLLDTSSLDKDEVVDKIIELVQELNEGRSERPHKEPNKILSKRVR